MRYFIFLFPFFIFPQIIDTVVRLNDWPLSLFYISKENKLYIKVLFSSQFFVVDCSTYEIKKVIPLPHHYPTSFAYGTYNPKRDKIYFGFNPNPESILVIDTKKDTIIKWINFVSCGPTTQCYNSMNDKIYAVDGLNVGVIDCETDSLIKIINHPQYWFSHFTCWDSIGNKVYCGCAYANVMGVIDCESDSLIKTISLPLIAGNACYNSFYRKLYVGPEWLGGGPKSAVICTRGDTLIKIFDTLYWNDEVPIIYNKNENKIYWPSFSPSNYCIEIIDCETDSIIKNIEIIDADFIATYFAEWSNRLYILSWYENKNSYNILYVLDCRNDSIISQLRFGKGAPGITGNPYTRQIYIIDSRDSSLFVIRDTMSAIEEKGYKKNKIDTSQGIRKSFLDMALLKNFEEIEIYDVSGKLVLRKRRDKISLRKIKKGIYVVKIDKEKRKFIVVK
ncbi:MAG: T9SS type A sorting domain-containing protein [candidate division WOR-3 bacterium]